MAGYYRNEGGLPMMLARLLFTASVLLCGLASAATLEERVQRQEDLQAIEKLLRDYGRLLDARDFEGYGKLFAKQGEWIGGFGRLKGPAEITKVVGERMTPRPGQPPIRGVHVFSNIDITLEGDRAAAVTKWQFLIPGPDGRPVIMMVGHYDDKLVREDGAWKFLERIAYGDVPFNDPLATTK
jgi:3-phenylpropionate/cinnamic acid dioxygenase small subunit